jgi:twitching motility protein PilI
MKEEPNTEEFSAYKALRLLAHKSLQSAHQLPAQKDVTPQWSGVGFAFHGLYFVVSMEELNEMLEVPAYTKLPGVQSWVKGVANVRGRLLPVFDLAAYFGGRLSGAKKQQRLLVIDRSQVYAGLWVDQVFGMQYFPVDSRTERLPKELPESLEPFVAGCFDYDGRIWTVFHPLKLLEENQFLDVAAY